MKTKPWHDEFGNTLEGIELERASRYWTAVDWEQFQKECSDPELCEEQLEKARDIETLFGDETTVWDFMGDEVPMPILNKRPELKRAISKLSSIHYQILREFYLAKKTDREIALGLGISSNAVKFKRHRALKKLKKAIERDKAHGLIGGGISI